MPFVANSAASRELPGRDHAPLLTVRLLGRLQVSLNGVAVQQWPSGRGRSLFKDLLTHRDLWPQREVLMETFWPHSSPSAARNSLNVAVCGLRRGLRAAADVDPAPAILGLQDALRRHQPV